MTRSLWKGPFVDGYLLKKAEKVASRRPQRSHQDLEPPLDHPAAVRRPDLRRPQRPQARAGHRVRRHDRPQVRRVRADPHLLRARGRQEGQEEVTMGKPKTERALKDNEAKAVLRMLAHQPAEAEPRGRS